MNIAFREKYGDFQAYYYGVYFEIRDGLNKSAPLLGVFYESKEYIFRSSGRHMWLKLHGSYFVEDDFHANYTVKQMNVTGMCFFFYVKCNSHLKN